MFARSSLPPNADASDHDDVIYLRDVSWEDFERLLAIRGERSVPRFTYLEGTVEIMSPSPTHEGLKSWIGRLLEVWCLEHDISFSTTGSWLLKERKEDRGVEPDESYIFGESRDLARPHLAIEVFWTSGRIDKLDVYRRLGVREVWIWRKGRIQPYALRGDQYVPLMHSEVLPDIDIDHLLTFLDRPTTSHAIRDYRAALAARKG